MASRYRRNQLLASLLVFVPFLLFARQREDDRFQPVTKTSEMVYEKSRDQVSPKTFRSKSPAILVIQSIAPPNEYIQVKVQLGRTNARTPLIPRIDITTGTRSPVRLKRAEIVAASMIDDGHDWVDSPRQRVFFWPKSMQAALPEDFEAVTTSKASESSRVCVWVDQAISVESEFVAELSRVLESILLSSDRRGWPMFRDIDGDRKLGVCVTGRLGQFHAPHGLEPPLYGIVRPSDFQAELDRPFGNQADVIYVSPALLNQPVEIQRAILAHEYAHVLQVSCGVQDGDWLQEAFAHTFESQFSSSRDNLSGRIDAYRHQPDRSPLVVTDSQTVGLWRDARSRGAGICFLNWWKATFGDAAFRQLLESRTSDCEKLAEIAGMPFADQWRDWAVSELVQPNPPMIHDFPDAVDSPSYRVQGMSTIYVRLPPHVSPLTVNCISSGKWQATIAVLPVKVSGTEF